MKKVQRGSNREKESASDIQHFVCLEITFFKVKSAALRYSPTNSASTHLTIHLMD
jgi:hypothetical protein